MDFEKVARVEFPADSLKIYLSPSPDESPPDRRTNANAEGHRGQDEDISFDEFVRRGYL